MYIEKLTKLDFDKFASLFSCSVADAKGVENNERYLKLFNGAMGPQPEMWISDFDLRTSTYYKSVEKDVKTTYINFMYKKFGQQYQSDYTTDFNTKMEEDRII